MEATEYMYSGLPIGSVGRLSNHPESQPICDRDKKNADVETCSDISK